MPCYSCAKSYGLFTKEVGCPNCGFSFCGKCVNYKCLIPKLNVKKKVCKTCFNLIQSGKMSEDIAPPDSFIKRLEDLDNPSRPPIILYKKDQRMMDLKSGLADEDKKIAERLERLREDREKVPLPTDSEMRRRLAVLKGENPDFSETTKMMFPTSDIRSDEEKAEDLLKQYMEEQSIAESIPKPDSEIEERLAALLANKKIQDSEESLPESGRKNKSPDDSSSDEEELAAAAVKEVERFMAEAALDDAPNPGADRDIPSPLVDKDGNELPWCIICNEDARLRCPECSDDLYCGFCWRDCHKQWKKLYHRPTAYFPPKKPEDSEITDSDKED